MKLHVYAFNLKTKQPLAVGSHFLSERSGYILLLAEGSNVTGVAEISPLPFLSKETLTDTLQELDFVMTNPAIFKSLTSLGLFSDLRWQKLQAKLSPSTSWGLYNIFKLKHHQSTQTWTHIRVNGLTRFDEGSDIVKSVIDFEKQGYSSVKIKVQPQHIEYQADTLREVFGQTERILIRLDANQSLTQKQLHILLKDQPHFRIEYIEEPLKPSENYFSELKSCQEEFKTDYAFDETLIQFKQFDPGLSDLLKNLKKHKIVSHFILKPMLLGARVVPLANRLEKYGAKCIISSSYESPVGMYVNSKLSNNLSFENMLNPDMGLDLTPFNIDWSRFVEKKGPSIRIQKDNIVAFCKDLSEVRTYELT